MADQRLKNEKKYIKYTVPKATLKRQIHIEKPGALSLEKKINTKKGKITVTKNINSDKSSTTFNHVHDSYSSFKDNNSDKSSIIVNHVPGSYSSFISDEIHKATINDWNPTNIQGKHYSYPPASVLATDVKSFGRVSKDHSFTREATFENIAIFLLKSPFLALADLLALVQASVLLSILWKNLVELKSVDFLPLQEVDTNYKSYTSIPSDKVKMFLACALFYNFDLASVIRFTGGNYTASHLDVDAILHKLREIGLQDDIYQHIKRALTIGCPAYFNAESSLDNFKAFLEYGNHSSIKQHIETVAKTMTKEYRHCYVIHSLDGLLGYVLISI